MTAWPDDKAFLGKPADASTGLTHVGAREYDPSIGQFLSVDPILALDQHQSLNGYVYANNTPVTFSDPTGLCIDPGNGHCMPDDGGKLGHQKPDKRGAPPPYDGPYDGTRESVGLGGGTASTDSSGNISSGPRYSCTGMSPAEMCKVVTGPGDKKENKGNDNPYGSFDLYGPQPELGMRELLRRLIEGPVCNPGYPCEDMKYNAVPAGPGGVGRPMPGPRRMPLGFANSMQFQAFKSQLSAGLKRAGHEDVTAIMQGSSVTGRSFKSGRPFGSHSDFDVALAGEGLLARAKASGISLRSGGTRTGPLKGADLERMGLGELRTGLSQSASREVNFMIYGSAKDAISRAPSIVMRP